MSVKYKNEGTIIDLKIIIDKLKKHISIQMHYNKIKSPDEALYKGWSYGKCGRRMILFPHRKGELVNSIIKDLEEEIELVKMFTKKGVGYEIDFDSDLSYDPDMEGT